VKKPPTILFQPINRIGLGHLSRLSAIALAVRAKVPEARVPFMVMGDSHSFLESLGLPHVSYGASMREPERPTWTREDQYELDYKVLKTIISKLQPQAVVFDLLLVTPALQAATELNIPTALVIRKSKDMQKYFNSIAPLEKFIKLFLFPHEPGEFSVPAPMADRCRFVGQITRAGRAVAGSDATPSTKKTIVITGGGGGHPSTVDFYNLALQAIAHIRDAICEFDILLITGPLFKEWRQLKLIDGVRLIPFDPDMLSTLHSANLVLCQGGYNTVAEVSSIGVRTICVPATRTFDDQYERAKLIAATSPHFHAWGGGMDFHALSEMIVSCLGSETPTPPAPSKAGGADIAADLILKSLVESSASASIS
jgi:UDP-N-acetylglucosamine:LPS N-acetylglucosamine transferase